MPKARTGRPRLRATSASTELNSSGRAIASRATMAAIAIAAAILASPALRPRIEPKSTRTPAVPLEPLAPAAKIERKRAPRPRTQAKTEPIATSSGRERSPSRPIPAATRIVAAKRPSRMSTPAAAAARAPVKATWLSASPAKT